MADQGGAWQSGVFDNGRDFQHGDKANASPVPGVPASMYNPPPSMASGKDGAYMPIISIALRCATIVFTLVAFAVLGSNQGEYCDGVYCSVWSAIKLSSNFAYLLAIDVIVCLYSIVQLVLSIVSACTGKPVLTGPKTPAAMITFVCDQVLTYMLMAGCGAGAAMSVVFNTGVQCNGTIFCDKNAASVAMSFIAFLCTALSAAMAYFRLYRIA